MKLIEKEIDLAHMRDISSPDKHLSIVKFWSNIINKMPEKLKKGWNFQSGKAEEAGESGLR